MAADQEVGPITMASLQHQPLSLGHNLSSRPDEFPAGMRVLVVDDDPVCLMVLERMLHKCNYRVTTCGKPTDALSLLREDTSKFDLVISDVYMPVMDGFQFLELVGRETDLPVIMMSGYAELSAVTQCINHGACDYLLKPVRIEELRNIWQHVVRKKRHDVKILGDGMLNKVWEDTVELVKMYVLSGKLYVYYDVEKQNTGVVFNSNFQLVGLISDESHIAANLLSNSQKDYVHKLEKVAYENWENVVEYDEDVLMASFKNPKEKCSNSHSEVPLGGRNGHSQCPSPNRQQADTCVLLDGCESGQRNCRDESNTWTPRGVETMQGAGYGGHVPLGNEQQRHVLTYPPGEVDAIMITDRDMESLQSESWLRDNIIDFYIMYLERNRLSSERRGHVYFFNSFFFPKLVGSTTQGKIGYEHVRNWTKDVNLFERKYIFIPVNQSAHWSLIIICNLASSTHEQIRSTYSLHLDSLKGRHRYNISENDHLNDDVETYIRQYLIEAWKEKYHAVSDPFGSLYSMKFMQAEVPQQDNGYDCGIYLLHYVERFLHNLEFESNFESTLMDHSIHTNQIPGIWFKSSEVSMKRKEIEDIIVSLSQLPRTCSGADKGADYAATKPALDQAVVALTMLHRDGFLVTSSPKSKKDKRKRDSNWTDDETSILVECKKEAAVDNESPFWKGKPDVTNWDVIAQKINIKLGTMSLSKTGDQCRLRWDTLTKSYRRVKEHCTSNNKEFSDLTRKERVELKLATTLSNVQWYEVIDQFCPPKPRKTKSQKPGIVVPNVEALSRSPNSTPFSSPMQIGIGNCFEPRVPSTKETGAMQDMAGFSTMSPVASDPPVKTEVGSLEPQESSGKEIRLAQVIPGCSVMNGDLNPVGFTLGVPIQCPEPELRKSSRKQVAIPGFSSMSQDLRITILNLVQAWPTLHSFSRMEKICRWLAIVQDRSPSETRSYVFKLLSRNLLTIWSRGSEGACTLNLRLSHLREYKKFVNVVMSKNSNYGIHSRILKDDSMTSFESSSMPQRIRGLILYKCGNLEKADLGKLTMLRSLSIQSCDKLKEILGWENLSELGWLEVSRCSLLNEHLRVHCLPSLKEFLLQCNYFKLGDSETDLKLDFSQSVRLRKVSIVEDCRATTVDLSTLKYLENLVFFSCVSFKSVLALSELHSLTKITICDCPALKRLPYLGHFKALAKLNLSHLSGVESITGFEDLPSLTHLTLRNCSALRRLPDLGGLQALTSLTITLADVEEIRGVEKLHSLSHLDLENCKALKRLAYLGHMKALVCLDISCTGVDEIPGVRELVNLETLDCTGSQLEWLPDLGHLTRLKWVLLSGTPLVGVPSSKYFEKMTVKYNELAELAEEVAEISDIDYVPSDQEVFDEDYDDDWNSP